MLVFFQFQQHRSGIQGLLVAGFKEAGSAPLRNELKLKLNSNLENKETENHDKVLRNPQILRHHTQGRDASHIRNLQMASHDTRHHSQGVT